MSTSPCSLIASSTKEGLALQGPTFGNGSMQTELHPWLAMHLEKCQSWAATLVTTIELLQQLSQDIPEAGVLSLPRLE